MNEPMAAEVTSTMCSSCLQLPLAAAGTSPHQDLHLKGALEGDSTYPNEAVYCCVACNTLWLRRTDRWGGDAGFRLAP